MTTQHLDTDTVFQVYRTPQLICVLGEGRISVWPISKSNQIKIHWWL